MKNRIFGLFGRKAKYEPFNWFEKFMSSHINIGNVVIYGENAMYWSVNIHTKKWGYICFTLPFIRRKELKFGHYFYLSPDGTPASCTYYRGSDKEEKIRAQIRKLNFGHNFNVDDQDIYEKLLYLNNKFSWLTHKPIKTKKIHNT